MDASSLTPDAPLPGDVPTLHTLVRELLVEVRRQRDQGSALAREWSGAEAQLAFCADKRPVRDLRQAGIAFNCGGIQEEERGRREKGGGERRTLGEKGSFVDSVARASRYRSAIIF